MIFFRPPVRGIRECGCVASRGVSQPFKPASGAARARVENGFGDRRAPEWEPGALKQQSFGILGFERVARVAQGELEEVGLSAETSSYLGVRQGSDLLYMSLRHSWWLQEASDQEAALCTCQSPGFVPTSPCTHA
ncbi:hypothetical protein Esti_004792 [Eimeria stiedai]